MMFAHKFILIDKTREWIIFEVENLRESKEFRISRIKPKCAECTLAKSVRRNECMPRAN